MGDENRLKKLQDFGQSIWMDYLRRNIVVPGQLESMMEQDGLRGVTSNPKIFDKSIEGSKDYDEQIRSMAEDGAKVKDIYETLTVQDVQMAADVFRPLYEESNGEHGYVSLEVSPHLAHDTEGTVEEARHLWAALDRPNVFIKVPATVEGLPAIERLVRQGVNVNVTLLFGLPRYREVVQAYITGIEGRIEDGQPVDRVRSVASFFLSRIDVKVDPKLEERMQRGGDEAKTAELLHGEVAVASAKQAYWIYKDIVNGERFRRLAEKGARPQRVLWASTSTKNPEYSDVKYVEALIGPETINTLPRETLDAFRDHGEPAARLENGLGKAREVLERLGDLGIDIDQVTQELEDEGVEKFNRPYDRLFETLEKQRQLVLHETPDPQTISYGPDEKEVRARIENLKDGQFVSRLWRKDPSLWKVEPEARESIRNGLGWLDVAEKMEETVEELVDFAEEIREAGFEHVVHMGMGGSSLTPLIFRRSFAGVDGGLPLTVLDTTDPETILHIEESVPIEKTLFIVASKSGTTAETRCFEAYFFDKVKRKKGDAASENFVAITDPGTPLVDFARKNGYRRTFLNFRDIGGRYSALSYFGLVPAVLAGVDVQELLNRALVMAGSCADGVPVDENPGVVLGTVMGELARRGRNKLTFIVPESASTLGMWLEQLLAESTGKEERGVLPVVGEPIGKPDIYGKDRLFVYLHIPTEIDPAQEEGIKELERAGHPVIRIRMDDLLDLGQEFFRWEIATATAGSILGIDAFDQPNVQESKDNTNRLLETAKHEGRLPEEEPTVSEGPLSVSSSRAGSDVRETLRSFLELSKPGDFIALQAYVAETPENQRALTGIRSLLRDHFHLATTLGYGPRFLHSTGQFHKGGPNTGVFLQLTTDDSHRLEVPGRPYTFGALRRAQAIGDLQALRKHGRRVTRIHLGGDDATGLEALRGALESSLKSVKA
jgi:transaldolase/glucose-6-phosphate isomerase